MMEDAVPYIELRLYPDRGLTDGRGRDLSPSQIQHLRNLLGTQDNFLAALTVAYEGMKR